MKLSFSNKIGMDDEEWSKQDIGALIYIRRRDWLSSSSLFLHLLHTKSCVVLPLPPLCCYQGFWSDSIQIKKLGLSQRRIVSIVSSTVDFLSFRIMWFGRPYPAPGCWDKLSQAFLCYYIFI